MTARSLNFLKGCEMTTPTLLDIAIQNGSDSAVGLIEETIKLIPEISGITEEGTRLSGVGAARTIKGLSYKTLARTALPTVGFRDANDGTTASKSNYENRTVETFILNPRWQCDKAVADKHEDGPALFIAREAMGIMEASMQLLGTQFFYGRGTGDTKGHPGLVDSIQAAYTYDATGIGSVCSSVWGVRFGEQDVQWVWGDNGALQMADPRIQDITGANGSPLTGYIQELLAYPGVQVGSVYSLCRIKNISATASHTLTDAMIYALLSQLKKRPDVWFMTRRSREQLRASRTATNQTGAPAPLPTEAAGIPIAVTESILNTETAA